MKYYVLYFCDYGYHFYPDKDGFDTLEQAIVGEKDIRSNGMSDVLILKQVAYEINEIEFNTKTE